MVVVYPSIFLMIRVVCSEWLNSKNGFSFLSEDFQMTGLIAHQVLDKSPKSVKREFLTQNPFMQDQVFLSLQHK